MISETEIHGLLSKNYDISATKNQACWQIDHWCRQDFFVIPTKAFWTPATATQEVNLSVMGVFGR